MMMDDLIKTGKVKKKNDDGMSGILENNDGRSFVWLDTNATKNGIMEEDPVFYLPIDAIGAITIGTNLVKVGVEVEEEEENEKEDEKQNEKE